MISSGVEIHVGLEPIDLRRGFHRLAGLVEDRLGRVARCGALFVLFGKDARGEAWVDGAQSGFAELAARLAALYAWLSSGTATASALDAAVGGELAWGKVEVTAALADADDPESVDVERFHALGRAAALTEGERLTRLVRRPHAGASCGPRMSGHLDVASS